MRFGTLGVRFLFVFVLAKLLPASSVGYYGLFTAAIGYALYIVGLDYYVFVNREIVKIDDAEKGHLLKNQLALVAALYLVFVPIAVVFLQRADWPSQLAWWFLPILALEHLNQEISRILIVLSQQITASIILFIRQGSWAIAAVALMSLQPAVRNLETVMLLWLVAGMAAAAVGLTKIGRLRLGGWANPVDRRWILRGVLVSSSFLVGTLALRGIQTFDRYWMKELVGIEIVGAYVLFFGVASALMVFLDAAVFSFTYPELIGHAHRGEAALGRAKVEKMLMTVVAVAAVFSFVSVTTIPYLLVWIGKPLYVRELSLYFWVLAGAVLSALGMVPHYALYALGHDKPIIVSQVSGFLVFLVTTWILSYFDRTVAVPAGVCIAFAFVMVWKTIAYIRALRLADQANCLSYSEGTSADL